MLLNNDHNKQELPGQLSLHFRLRGSWLIGKTYSERQQLYKIFGNIYAIRSQIAHNGFSSSIRKLPLGKRQQTLTEHIRVGERVFREILLSGRPKDWASLILGSD